MFNILRFTCKESFTFRGSAMAARPRGCADGASERRTVLPMLPRGTDQHVQDASTLRAPRTWTTVGCATSPTSIDAQWASPGIASRDRVQNVLVIAALRDSRQRRMLEDRMVEALGAAGTVPPPSPSPLTLATPGCRRPGSPATRDRLPPPRLRCPRLEPTCNIGQRRDPVFGEVDPDPHHTGRDNCRLWPARITFADLPTHRRQRAALPERTRADGALHIHTDGNQSA
jgi:hypothetical protein